MHHTLYWLKKCFVIIYAFSAIIIHILPDNETEKNSKATHEKRKLSPILATFNGIAISIVLSVFLYYLVQKDSMHQYF